MGRGNGSSARVQAKPQAFTTIHRTILGHKSQSIKGPRLVNDQEERDKKRGRFDVTSACLCGQTSGLMTDIQANCVNFRIKKKLIPLKDCD